MVSGAVFSDVSISKIVDECLEIRSDIGTGVFKRTVGHWWGTPANVRLSDVFRGHCIAWANVDLDLHRHMASLGPNELMTMIRQN